MPRVPRHPLLRFAVTVIALLPTCFLAWHFLGAVVAAPAVMLAKAVLGAWLPELIEGVYLQGTELMVMSTLGEVDGIFLPAQVAGNQLAFPVDTRLLSYSVPFFCALFFATPRDGGWGELAWSLLALWVLMGIGFVAITFKNLMLGLGERFFSTAGAPPADAIALVYQFSTLMVPPLTPVILWAYTSRDNAAFKALLPEALLRQAAPRN